MPTKIIFTIICLPLTKSGQFSKLKVLQLIKTFSIAALFITYLQSRSVFYDARLVLFCSFFCLFVSVTFQRINHTHAFLGQYFFARLSQFFSFSLFSPHAAFPDPDVESLPIPPRPSFFKALNQSQNNANQSASANNNHALPSSPPTYSRLHQQQQQANNRDSPKFSSAGRPPPPYPTRTSASSVQQRPLPIPNLGSGTRTGAINDRGPVSSFFQNKGE